jgi:serine/threonine-protein kinase
VRSILIRSRSEHTSRFPTDLFVDATRRLRVACLVWAGIWGFGLVMNNLVSPAISPDAPLDDAWPIPANPVAAVVIAGSLVLYAVLRRFALASARVLDLALGYEVFVALAIGIVNQWTPNVHAVSWVAVVILVHPLLVPTPPMRTLVASLLAASMDPVGLLISHLRGVALPPFEALLWANLPTYLCAGMAVIPARIFDRLGREVRDARDIGAYRLGELLGRGGMGEVYRGEHRLLARPAAIKVIRPELLGAPDGEARARLLRRFEREAQVTASLRSPHTVRVFDYGMTEDGTFYYVMELLDGMDLDRVVREGGPMDPPRALRILLQVLDALGEAHAEGLVHRDVKPNNVVIGTYGRRPDFVKVLDFGLARPHWGSSKAAVDGTTDTASISGTPSFMAPEQALGREVDARADLYAVGTLAFWLLTGQAVFEGRTGLEVMTHHLRRDPDPPSARRAGVPRALDEAVLACLAKDPEGRPPSADALSARLRAVQAELRSPGGHVAT